jgi:hypothetical protein
MYALAKTLVRPVEYLDFYKNRCEIPPKGGGPSKKSLISELETIV